MANNRPTVREILSVADRLKSTYLASLLRICAGQQGIDLDLDEIDERLMRIERVLIVLERARPLLDEEAKRLVTAILTFDHLELDAYLDEHKVLVEPAEVTEVKSVPLIRGWRLEYRKGGPISNELVSVHLFQHFDEIVSWESRFKTHADQGRSLEEMLDYEQRQLAAADALPQHPRRERERPMLQRRIEVFAWLNEHCILRR